MITDEIELSCPYCHSNDHNWKSIYFEDNATLKKADSTYISWCSKQLRFVVQEKIDELVDLEEFLVCLHEANVK